MGTIKEKVTVKKELNYYWWIQTDDEFTDGVISNELVGVDLEEIKIEGSSIRAWPCDFKLVKKLKKASATSRRSLLYRVYNRRGGGRIRRVPIFEPTK